MSTDPLTLKGTFSSGQKQLISGVTHCFFEEEVVVAGFLCLFPKIDEDDNVSGNDAGAGDDLIPLVSFLLLVAFFHKLLTLSISAYKKE